VNQLNRSRALLARVALIAITLGCTRDLVAMPFDLFGWAVDCRDAPTKDGSALILIGDAADSDSTVVRAGAAWIVSAQTGQLILHVEGENPGDRFGQTVAFVDDLDGDGVSDFVVAATRDWSVSAKGELQPRKNPNGYLRWFSGKDGRLLHHLDVPVISGLSPALATIGDLDGDGKRELLVGLGGGGADASGMVLVISSRDYASRLTVVGKQAHQCMGVAVCELGDVNHDGVPDFAASAVPDYNPVYPRWPQGKDGKLGPSGSVFILSGKDGSVIDEVRNPRGEGFFGTALCGGSDLDGDAIPDLVVTLADPSAKSAVLGYSGADRKMIREWHQRDRVWFGASLCLAGDLNGDGTPDLVVGAPDSTLSENSTSTWILSGKSDEAFHRLDPTQIDDTYMGVVVKSVSDCNRDGVRDVVVGAACIACGGQERGAVLVFSGKTGEVLRRVTRWHLQEQDYANRSAQPPRSTR
jgi:hypothetical protein